MVAVSIVRVPTVFFAHASVRITDLTAHQTAEIFAGNIKSWAEVGGPDLRIRVVRREEADSTLQVLRATMPDWKDLVFTDRSKTAVTTQEASRQSPTMKARSGLALIQKRSNSSSMF